MGNSNSRSDQDHHGGTNERESNPSGEINWRTSLENNATMNFNYDEYWKRESPGDTDGESEDDTESQTSDSGSSVRASTSRLDPNSNSKDLFRLRLIHGGDVTNISHIGEGMFGKAMKGTLEGKKSYVVAIKIFNLNLTLNEGQAKLLRLMSMKHRNVVAILGVILDSTNTLLSGPIAGPRVVLQYFPEGNLLNFLSKKENPQDYAMLGKFALDILNGCQYLHSQEIIHGNLAARNILVQKCVSKYNKTHYNALVSDYGISQFALDSSTKPSQLEDEKYLDCIRWMPKELVAQIVGDERTTPHFTKETDVWSFGVVLHEMWTKGAVPFGSTKLLRVYKYIVKEGKSPLSHLRPKGCPEHIVEVMDDIFRVNPRQRPTFDILYKTFQSFRTYHRQKKTNSESEKAAPAPAQNKKETKSVTETDALKKGKEGQPKSKPNVDDNVSKRCAAAFPPDTPQQSHSNSQGNDIRHPSTSQPQPQKKTDPSPKGKPNPPNPNFNPGTGRGKQPRKFGAGPTHRFQGPSKNYGPGPAPPPYTPTPGPSSNNSQIKAGQKPPDPVGNLETEIERKQRELEQLKAQKLQAEFMQKQSELNEIAQKLAQQNISGISGSGTRVDPPSLMSPEFGFDRSGARTDYSAPPPYSSYGRSGGLGPIGQFRGNHSAAPYHRGGWRGRGRGRNRGNGNNNNNDTNTATQGVPKK